MGSSSKIIFFNFHTMILFASSLLLVPLANSHSIYGGLLSTWVLATDQASRQLMSGKFVMRPMLGDHMFLKQYLDFWGLEATPEEISKLPLEISVAEDGTEVTMMYAGDSTTYKLGQTQEVTDSASGTKSMQTVRLVGPNILTQETDAMEASGIYEMRSYTFYPAGVQVSAVASKPGTWSLMGNSVSLNSVMERVDEDGNAKPLMLGWM